MAKLRRGLVSPQDNDELEVESDGDDLSPVDMGGDSATAVKKFRNMSSDDVLSDLGFDKAVTFGGGSANAKAGLSVNRSVDKTWVDLEWHGLLRHMSIERGFPTLLTGPGGTGKTTAVMMMVRQAKGKLFVLQGTKSTDESRILGYMGVENGATVFHPAAFVQSVMYAKAHPDVTVVFLFEEVSAVRDQAVMSCFATFLSGTNTLFIPELNATIVRPENWRFVGTYNPGYVGTTELNEAFSKSRCFMIECDYMPPDKEAQALALRYPSHKNLARRLVTFATGLRQAKATGEHDYDITFRCLCQIVELTNWLGDEVRATELVVLPKIGAAQGMEAVRKATMDAARLVLGGGGGTDQWKGATKSVP